MSHRVHHGGLGDRLHNGDILLALVATADQVAVAVVIAADSKQPSGSMRRLLPKANHVPLQMAELPVRMPSI